MVAIDIMGPVPQVSCRQIPTFLVASNYFTRWVKGYATPNLEATNNSQEANKRIFLRLGIPEQLHASQGRNF